jgi:hypothetical protein
LGSDELAKGSAGVKDLSASEAAQRDVPLKELVKFFQTSP